MRYTLVITFPDGAVHSFPVGDAAITIGRSPATAIRVPEDGVSRQHCVISPAGGRLIVLDQGSTNGTFVNGALIKQARLSDGDVVQVGSTRIRVQVRDAEDSEPVMRPTQPPPDHDDDDIDTLTFELTGQTQVLQRLAERLASSDGAASAAELVLDAIFEVFPVDRAYILTRRRDRNGIIPEIVASKSRASTARTTGELDIEVPRLVLEKLTFDPDLTNATEATAAIRAALSERFANPILCTPLRHAGETFGALYLDALTLPVWAHSAEMLEFLSSVGALTALAMTRARLQAELNLEQRLSQRRLEARDLIDDVNQRRQQLAADQGEERPGARGELLHLGRLHVEVTQDLLGRVMEQFLALDERLAVVGRSLDDGSEEATASFEAMVCAQRIVTAVEDVAALAKLESGRELKGKERVSIAELIERALSRHRASAEEAQVRLVSGSIEEGLDAPLDGELMKRVMDHLISEAVKHTPRGGRVVISGRRRAANVELIVADTGDGVPRGRRERVFSGEPCEPDDRGGVSMYFCRKVVEGHGGAIRVTGPTGNNQVILSLPVD